MSFLTEELNPPSYKYYDYITTAYILNTQTGAIINHITLGEYPFLGFHHPKYILLPPNEQLCIGVILDRTSTDKCIDLYYSQKQQMINKMFTIYEQADDPYSILQHCWHPSEHELDQVNLAEEIMKDIKLQRQAQAQHTMQTKAQDPKQAQLQELAIRADLALCACHLSQINPNVMMIPEHSPPPYNRGMLEEFLDEITSSRREHARLIKLVCDVDWMLSSIVSLINIPPLTFEFSKQDVDSNLILGESMEKYNKWIQREITIFHADLHHFSKEG